MNIFDALSARKDNKLREVNLSALLGYFLNPVADHGIRCAFLDAFLRLVQDASGQGDVFSDINSAKTLVESEFLVETKNGNFFFDVLVDLFDKKGANTHALIIETKIRKGAAQSKQLKNYYDAARKYEENEGKTVVMVFLTPNGGKNNKKLRSEFDNLTVQVRDGKAWIYWNGADSVQTIIRENILAPEAAGVIAPINEYSRHTLKAFAMHLDEYTMSARQTHLRDDEEWVSVPGTDYTISHCNRMNFHVYQNGELLPAQKTLLHIADEVMNPPLNVKKEDETKCYRPGKIGRAILDAIKKRESGK